MLTDRTSSRWMLCADQAARTLVFWFMAAVMLGAGRILLMAIYADRRGPRADAGQVLAALANGARLDGQTALAWALIPLLAGLVAVLLRREAPVRRVRTLFWSLFVIVTTLLAVIDIGFFREYDDQFNHFVLGVVFDDLRAVLLTVWKGYPVVWAVLGLALLDLLLIRLGLFAIRKARAPRRAAAWPRWARATAVLGFAWFLVVAGRGTAGTRPLQRKDLAVTADPFLNKTIANPYRALLDAVRDYRKLANPAGILAFLPDADIRSAVARLTGSDPGSADLDSAFSREAAGAANPPRHIFLVILESYSAWPLIEPYRALHLAGEMERLGKDGLLLTGFLPAGAGTMTSLAPLLTGLPDSGVPINYQASSRTPYPASAAALFRSLGYRTRFFYGGYLSWERLGDFARDQGFEEVYGGGDMGSWVKGNEWGVHDSDLYDFTLRTVSDDQPSFNVVLTVSNHPPFDIDPYAQGFPLREMPETLRGMWDGGFTLEHLGHFWYSDRCFGRFVDAAEKTLPGILVAATADHYGRRFLNGRPGVVESAAVPFLLYGPEVMKGAASTSRAWGSHLDIVPTLVELAAPAGFRYDALGRDLLSTRSGDLSFGAGRAVGEGFLAELWSGRGWVPLPGFPPPAAVPDLDSLRRRDNDLKAVSWWRVMKGPGLPSGGPGGEGRVGAR